MQETASNTAAQVRHKPFQVKQSVQLGDSTDSFLALYAPGLPEYASGGYFLNSVRIDYALSQVVFLVSPFPPKTRSIEATLVMHNDDVIARLIDVVRYSQPIVWVSDPVLDYEVPSVSGKRFLPTCGVEADLLAASLGEVSLAKRAVCA